MSLVRNLVIVVVVSAALLLQWRVIEMRDAAAETPSLPAPPGIARSPVPRGPSIGLVVGHWSKGDPVDPGALCLDDAGAVELSELQINLAIARRVQDQLKKTDVRVWLLEEKDARLPGLHAALALSLHADSCIDATGFKAAYTPGAAAQIASHTFVECLRTEYAAHTGQDWHAYSITDDMLYYHMHAKVAPSTPSVILEMGFLGGDRRLLTQQQDRVSDGIVASILCFLDSGDSS